MRNKCAPAVALGKMNVECRTRRGEIRWRRVIKNGVTLQGANRCLDRCFNGASDLSWYALLIADSGFIGTSELDTALSHTGWSEFLGVSGSRPAYTFGTAGGGVISSVGSTSSLITSGGSIRGIGMASALAVGSTDGVLYSTAVAEDPLPVVPTDTVYTTYSIRYTPLT